MKRINKIVFAFTAALLFLACSKQLDINTDPNNPALSQGTPKLVFPSAVASSIGRIGADLAILGGIWSQFWTQNTTSNQYKNIDSYDLSKSDYGPTWDELYAGSLNDANFVVTKAKETGDWNFFLMGTVIKAYTYQVLVDLYDQVPYTEAFSGANNLQPKFDDGYTVYKGLLAELDTALSKNFSASTNTPAGEADLVFPDTEDHWTIDNWIKFANTLKLKMYLRMVYAKPGESQAGITAMYNAGAEFLDVDASVDIFEDAPDKSNPLYEFNFRKLNTDANLKASMTFLSFLQDNDDPRIPFYFQPTTGTTDQYSAINQGDYLNPNTVFNVASKARVGATDPVDYISLAESNFLQAEALERYFGGVGAKAKYDAGVMASFERYGLDATDFLQPGGAYEYPSAGTFEQKLEAIIVQKWASMPNSHALEAFFEKNRTGYPRTSTVYSTDPNYVPGQFVYPKNGVTNGVFATRLIFPDEETSKNANAPEEKPLTDKVWWDVK
jgi:hypothetical protein